MRIISQSGKGNYPFEKCMCSVKEDYKYKDGTRQLCGYWIGVATDTHNGDIRIAEYSSEKKALKVMELLRNAYREYKKEENYRYGVSSINPDFQFPKDAEIEV